MVTVHVFSTVPPKQLHNGVRHRETEYDQLQHLYTVTCYITYDPS